MNIENYRKLFLALVVGFVLVISGILIFRFFAGEKVNIIINSIPQSASIEFDGKNGKSPIKFKETKEGKYTASLSKEGYIERKEKIEVTISSANFYIRLYTEGTSPSVLGADLSKAAKIAKSDFEKLFRHIPFTNEKFVIEPRIIGGKASIYVTALGIINRPEQFESFKKEQRQNAQAALDWIRGKGVDPDKLNIVWFDDPFN